MHEFLFSHVCVTCPFQALPDLFDAIKLLKSTNYEVLVVDFSLNSSLFLTLNSKCFPSTTFLHTLSLRSSLEACVEAKGRIKVSFQTILSWTFAQLDLCGSLHIDDRRKD
jgi:hypothetical protein